jgi:transcriptional regulator with XRE-family HTH domain
MVLFRTWRSAMAKIKVRPHPGALSALLKKKNMSQVDAWKASRVDRKTLARIDRGEEVKKETLQSLANSLHVPMSFFDPPSSPNKKMRGLDPLELAIDDDDILNFADAEIMLRELDADGLLKLLKKARRINWHLNVQPSDEKIHELLEQLDKGVQEFHLHVKHESPEDMEFGGPGSGLRRELSGLKKGRAVANLMKRLAEYRISILGADYLGWNVSKDRDSHPGPFRYVHKYTSTHIVELSIEKHGVQTRRQPIIVGSVPPKRAPETNPPTEVIVDGMSLGWRE